MHVLMPCSCGICVFSCICLHVALILLQIILMLCTGQSNNIINYSYIVQHVTKLCVCVEIICIS